MTGFLKTLLLLSASGSVLGLALTLARRVFGRRLPSALWYFAWLPVLLRLVLPLPTGEDAAALTAVSADAEVDAENAASDAAQTGNAEKRGYRYDGFGAVYVPETESETADVSAAAAGEAAGTAAKTTGEAGAPASALQRMLLSERLKNPGLWLAVWLCGAAICFTRYTAGYIRFRRVLTKTLETTDGRTARVYRELTGDLKSYPPRLFCSAYVKTPMLLGLIRPLVVLPQTAFTEESARNILRHELTHYRRGDLYVKWFFVLAASLHWFNPLMPLFRRELDRTCELSCDEAVLARMRPSERRSYGETLLELAANRTLPAGVVATTFATEKRALKERLEQIMRFKFKPRAILALTVAALVLMAAASLAAAPARANARASEQTEAAVVQTAETSVQIPAASTDGAALLPTPDGSASGSFDTSTHVGLDVDEFLAAIAPNASITLSPGLYDLSMASDYGQDTDSEYYRWEAVFDGYELVIMNVENLTITADADDVTATVISAVPRYADVLAFSDCDNITLSGFTAGHTVEQGRCAGGVIHLMGTDGVTVNNCALYGCGVLGVQAENCRNIDVRDTDIYECSSGAVELTSCVNVRFDGCDFRDCYDRYGDTPSPAFTMFNISSCRGVVIADGHVYGNYVYELVHVYYSQEVYLLGTLFEDNVADNDGVLWYSGTVLNVTGDPITVSGCEFRDDCPVYAAAGTSPAVDADGSALSNDDLAAMELKHVDFTGFAEPETVELEWTRGADGLYEVHVSTVDEFLAAIAPDTTVYLDEGLYDLSTANNYGAYGGQYYYWADMFDGPGLVITGVENFSVVGAGSEATRVEALPRYADVIRFDDCKNVSVSGLTAGHTLGAGMCAGAVLDFIGCENVFVRDCALFGCGTWGVEATGSLNIHVEANEIYECSYGAAQLSLCIGAVFADNDIHDCAYPTYRFGECLDVTVDGKAVEDEPLAGAAGYAAYASQEAAEAGDPIYEAIVQRGAVIRSATIDVPDAGPYKSAAENN